MLLNALLLLAQSHDVSGSWRAVLDQAGGPLQFGIRIERDGARWRGSLSNAGQRQPFTAVRYEGDTLRLEMDGYAASISAVFEGDSMLGTYQNLGRRGPRVIPFHASRGEWAPTPVPPELAGQWDAWFEAGFESTPRVLEFRNGSRGFEGTIISNSGDYGLFSGQVVADSFLFSHFDGSYVYRLTGRLNADTLRGTFYAGLRTQTSFVATRSTGKPHLRPPTEITRADPSARFTFSFPDLNGNVVSQDDPRFRGKVVLVDVFGTWCPNCHEAAPTLVQLYRKYRSRGLEMVGLAFEATGDPELDALQVRRYGERYGITFPLLMGGISENEVVAASLPQLVGFTAFPTTILLDREGRVRWIRAGFYGPATGAQYRLLVEQLDRRVAELLDQPARTP